METDEEAETAVGTGQPVTSRGPRVPTTIPTVTAVAALAATQNHRG
ncbi:MAG: hypothetical protein ACRD5I_14265 [Candidatus Acidiferrales bacterium]